MTNVARLPGPIAEEWDWQLLGLCRGQDSGRFFHPDGERGASRGRREAAAKALCQTCPVRAECAAHALSTREPYGVWGGFTEAERLRLLDTGWEDLADRRRSRVDVIRLEVRLGIRPAAVQRRVAPVPGASLASAGRGLGTRTAVAGRTASPAPRSGQRRPAHQQPAGRTPAAAIPVQAR
jgi:WhiB family redox-sensing transcriptional regulator